MKQNQISFLFAFIRVNSRLKKLFASNVGGVISRTALHDGLLDFPRHLDKFQAVAKTLAASNERLHSDFIAGIREGEFQADEGAPSAELSDSIIYTLDCGGNTKTLPIKLI